MGYVMRHKKPLYTHFHPVKRKLTQQQKDILFQKFEFVKRLEAKKQKNFEHRVASFMKDTRI